MVVERKRARYKRRKMERVWRVEGWYYPAFVVIAMITMAFVGFDVTYESVDGEQSGSVSPSIWAIILYLSAIILFIKVRRARKYQASYLQSLSEGEQFLAFTEDYFEYGYEGKLEVKVAYDALVWQSQKSVFAIQVGGHTIVTDKENFTPEELEFVEAIAAKHKADGKL